MRYFSSFDLVHNEIFSTRKEAINREIQLKKYSRTKKEAIIAGSLEPLKQL